jgi:acetylornithine/N-succinyldiaminopimelate aminotransferase
MFAYQWSNIEPDIMTIAKAIGNGFPIGACLTSKKVGDAMEFGSHGSTFGGNPLACSVGNAVLDLMTSPKFFSEVVTVSEKLLLDLNKVAYDYPDIIEGIRGKGFILGLKCNINNEDFVKEARKNFILTVKASDNVVRLLPPINLSNSECDEAIDKIIGGRSLTTLSEALTVKIKFLRASLTKSSLFMLHFNPRIKPLPLMPSIISG